MLQGSATRGKCKIREKGTSPSAAVPPVQTSEIFVMECVWLFWKLGTGEEGKATGKERQAEHFIFEFPFSKWRNRKDLCYINPDRTLNGCRDFLQVKAKPFEWQNNLIFQQELGNNQLKGISGDTFSTEQREKFIWFYLVTGLAHKVRMNQKGQEMKLPGCALTGSWGWQ